MPRRPQKLDPVHPGKILLEQFLTPLGLSQYRLAKDTSVPLVPPSRDARGLNSCNDGMVQSESS
jgi:hypothetical protein